jgi:hypothetical protein
VQIKKDEEELNRAWGSGPPPPPQPQYKGPRAPKGTAQLTAGPQAIAAAKAAAAAAAAAAGVEGGSEEGGADGEEGGEGADGRQQQQPRLTTIAIFGDAKAVEKAVGMIEEAVANRAQKEKQRAAQYEKKREQKRRDRCARPRARACACVGGREGAAGAPAARGLA